MNNRASEETSERARCSFWKYVYRYTRVWKPFCECTQNIYGKCKNQIKKKEEKPTRNCQIYDITRIHDRHNNNEPSRYYYYSPNIDGSFALYFFSVVVYANGARI